MLFRSAAGAGGLGDDAGAVGGHLDDGETDVVIARNVEPIGGEAAGGLCAALDQVAGDGGAGDPVVVGGFPAEVGEAGAHGEGRIGHAAGDDDVSAGAEGLGDRCGAEIGVGGDEPGGDGGEGRTSIRFSKKTPVPV